MSTLTALEKLVARTEDDRTCEHKEWTDQRIEMTCKECRRYERKRPHVARRKLESLAIPLALELIKSQKAFTQQLLLQEDRRLNDTQVAAGMAVMAERALDLDLPLEGGES